jgi:hypothetical protein
MRIKSMLQVPAMILLAANAYAAGKPEKCVNPKLTWEIRSDGPSSSTSRITDDRTGSASRPYVDGVEGVTANLFFCGSGDATLLPGSTRQVTLDFSQKLDGLPRSSFTGNVFLNVYDILYPASDRSQEYTFTTWLGSSLPSPRGSDWRLRAFNPDADAAGSNAEHMALANTPYTTAKVIVNHCPVPVVATPSALCAGVTKETWFVHPDPAPPESQAFGNVVALLNLTKSGPVSLGQFEMPFYFVISIK